MSKPNMLPGPDISSLRKQTARSFHVFSRLALGLMAAWPVLILFAAGCQAQVSPALPIASATTAATQAPALPSPTPTVSRTPESTPTKPAVFDHWALGTQAASFDPLTAYQQIETLTSPSFSGRQAGSPEGRAAAEWIASQFSQYGLQPAGDSSTFFQNFSLYYAPLEESPLLSFVDSTGNAPHLYQPFDDFAPIFRLMFGPGYASGDVIWVDACQKSDFKVIDVSGKIVLCDAKPTVEVSRNVFENGAAGLLLIAEDSSPQNLRNASFQPRIQDPIPALNVTCPVVDDLLSTHGLSCSDLVEQTEPFGLNVRVKMEVAARTTSTCPGPQCPAQNVLGVLPGKDPVLAEEIVIVGAHYDHMGQAPGGLVWPGANDNASGVAVMLEIARQWQLQDYQPSRTVLFAAWDGEEMGLAGSQFYVHHPRYHLDNTVAMLQLDMVGYGSERLFIQGSTELAQQLVIAVEDQGFAYEVGNDGGSDHASFMEMNVQAAQLTYLDALHPDTFYHRPGDLPETIDLERLERVGRAAGLVLLQISSGSWPER